MARMRRRLVVGMVLLGLSGLTPVAAETIPLPKAAPQPKERRSPIHRAIAGGKRSAAKSRFRARLWVEVAVQPR